MPERALSWNLLGSLWQDPTVPHTDLGLCGHPETFLVATVSGWWRVRKVHWGLEMPADILTFDSALLLLGTYSTRSCISNVHGRPRQGYLTEQKAGNAATCKNTAKEAPMGRACAPTPKEHGAVQVDSPLLFFSENIIGGRTYSSVICFNKHKKGSTPWFVFARAPGTSLERRRPARVIPRRATG